MNDIYLIFPLEIRHKKDFYLDGNNQLMLIREITGVPSKQVFISVVNIAE